MRRKYTRVEQRRHKAEKMRQVALVTKRLLGKQPTPPPILPGEIFGGSTFHYGFRSMMYQRPSTWSIINGMEGL